jgi:mycofactocin precursor
METREQKVPVQSENGQEPEILEEIVIEDLSIDGICGVY